MDMANDEQEQLANKRENLLEIQQEKEKERVQNSLLDIFNYI